MKAWFGKMVRVCKRILAFLLNPRLLLCLGLGWMITNGWCYLFLIFGAWYDIPWMVAVGGAYAAILWFPFTLEKVVTIAIAIFLLRLLFPHDKATLAVLQEEARLLRRSVHRFRVVRRARRALKKMKRVIVIGCPGAGKSTFARALQDLCGLPLVYMDQLYWRADKTTVSHEELDTALETVLEEQRWIIDGNYMRTLARRLAAADTVFFLDYPVDVCIDGILERQGTIRPDMPWVEETVDEELLALVRRFPEESRPKIEELLATCPKKQIIAFHTREEAEDFLAAASKQK